MADMRYPFKTYNYRVLIDRKEEAGFCEVSAPGITLDPEEYREDGKAAKIPGKKPGILKYFNVFLLRGTTSSPAFLNWMLETRNGVSTRKTVTVTLLDDEMRETAAWQLEKAWPTKYYTSDLSGPDSEAAIESLELVCEGVTRIK